MSRALDLRGGSGRASRSRKRDAPAGRGLGSYLERSQLPLTCLVFLMPLMVLYEAGTRMYATDALHHTEQRIVAFTLVQRFFHIFGASGRYMPAMTVAGILLAWHIARKDPWRLDVGAAVGMVVESVLLCLPLFLLNALSMRYVPLYTGVGSLPARAVFSLGAGIYEELVFRLIAFTFLSILLVDILHMSKGWAILLMVCLSSILFAAYHYLGLGESFSSRIFAFRIAAGIYFGVIFFARGFGVTAGTHVSYDIVLVLLRVMG